MEKQSDKAMFTREDYKLFDKHFDHHYFFDAAGKQLKHPSDIIHNIDDIPSYIPIAIEKEKLAELNLEM